jgi:hypothetical protein
MAPCVEGTTGTTAVAESAVVIAGVMAVKGAIAAVAGAVCLSMFCS